jgi:periplasmic protein TonB
MEPVATFDELIFEGRNRAYGAFDLRQNYKPTLARALGLGVGLFLLALFTPALLNELVAKKTDAWLTEATLTKLPVVPPIDPPIPLPMPETAPQVATVRNLLPLILPDADVTIEEIPPTIEELREATTSHENAEATGNGEEIILLPEESTPSRVEQAIETAPVSEEPFLVVEQNPDFPGGSAALQRFLAQNLRYPAPASRANVSGRVFVGFVVNANGSIADVQLLRGIGFGCDEEAKRVIELMPRWKPGKQAGRAVRVRFTLPIVFALE